MHLDWRPAKEFFGRGVPRKRRQRRFGRVSHPSGSRRLGGGSLVAGSRTRCEPAFDLVPDIDSLVGNRRRNDRPIDYRSSCRLGPGALRSGSRAAVLALAAQCRGLPDSRRFTAQQRTTGLGQDPTHAVQQISTLLDLQVSPSRKQQRLDDDGNDTRRVKELANVHVIELAQLHAVD
jgi:hypothetical protein